MPKKKPAKEASSKTAKRKTSPAKLKRKIVLKAKVQPAVFVSTEEILKRINFVQTERKETSFIVAEIDSLIVDNILGDAGVVFVKEKLEKGVSYVVSPGVKKEEGAHALEALEELDDEIIENGQCFD